MRCSTSSSRPHSGSTDMTVRRMVIPIHTAIASDVGLPVYLGRYEAMGPEGATFHVPASHTAFEL